MTAYSAPNATFAEAGLGAEACLASTTRGACTVSGHQFEAAAIASEDEIGEGRGCVIRGPFFVWWLSLPLSA